MHSTGSDTKKYLAVMVEGVVMMVVVMAAVTVWW